MAKRSKRARTKVGDSGPTLTPELKQVQQQAIGFLNSTRRKLYSLGTLYNGVQDRKLAEAAGFTNTDDYWLRNIPTDDVKLPVVILWAKLARKFSSDVCNAYRSSCLGLLLRGLKHQGREPPEDPGDLDIEFDDPDGHHTQKFRDCTKEEMELFVHGTAPSSPNPPPQLSADDKKDIANIQRMFSFCTLDDEKVRVTGELDEDGYLILNARLPAYWFPNIVLSLEAWALDQTKGTRPPSAPLSETPRKRKRR